jgi:hypothetical protein
LGLTHFRLKNTLFGYFVLSHLLWDFDLSPSPTYSASKMLLEGATVEHSEWGLAGSCGRFPGFGRFHFGAVAEI